MSYPAPEMTPDFISEVKDEGVNQTTDNEDKW